MIDNRERAVLAEFVRSLDWEHPIENEREPSSRTTDHWTACRARKATCLVATLARRFGKPAEAPTTH